MADVNWALGIMPNAGEAFTQAFQQGQQTARQNRARAALAALAKDPNNTGALSALAESDPETAMQFRKQQLEYSKAQLAQHQDSILKGAQIVRELKPTDQAGWDRARAIAAQAGVDISQVPAQFDPQYAQGIVSIADAFKPENTNSNQVVVTPQPGAPALIYDKQTGAVRTLVAPNDGSHAPGSPVVAEPPAEAIARLKANPQEAAQFDEIFGPGASQKALGGQTVAPSGPFQP